MIIIIKKKFGILKVLFEADAKLLNYVGNDLDFSLLFLIMKIWLK